MRLKWQPTHAPDIRQALLRDLKANLARDEQQREEIAKLPAWAATMIPLSAPAVTAAEQRYADVLPHLELYWASHDVAATALDASHDVLMFDHTNAPSVAGLMMFAKPLPAFPLPGQLHLIHPTDPQKTLTYERPVKVWAISWAPVAGGRLRVGIYTRSSDLPGRVNQYQSTPIVETCALIVPANYDFDDTIASDALGKDLEIPSGGMGPLAFLGSAWSMMAQPMMVTRRHDMQATHATPPLEAGSPSTPSTVHLVTLRPMRQDTDAAPAAGHKRKHRYVVRGHWRQQPYGPQHSLRRQQWIESYIAGPADAPLLSTQKVWVWRH